MARKNQGPGVGGRDPLAALEQRAAAAPTDAPAWYALGVARLDVFHTSQSDDDLRRAYDALTRAVELDPGWAPAHAALAFAADLGIDFDAAVVHARRAAALAPDNETFEAFAIGRLVDAEAEAEAMAAIEAAALRRHIDLADLRRQLEAVGFPTDASHLLMNGFVHGKNFLRSWLSDEAERVLDAAKPGRAQQRARDERADCERRQRELAAEFETERVPKPLQPLAPWAKRLGVGDDPCRAFLFAELSAAERRTVARATTAQAQAIDGWLDSFAEGEMPPEAGAFLYLLSGVEEMEPG